MSEFLMPVGIILAVLVIGIAAVIFIGAALDEHLAARRRLTAADVIEIEFRQAKAAMNEAAGQSWRNLAD